MVRQIVGGEANLIAARNGVNSWDVPSGGFRVFDRETGRDYILYYRVPNFIAFDVTATNPETGERIDPSIVNLSWLDLYIRSILDGIKDSVPEVASYAGLALFGMAAIVVYNWSRRP